MNASGPEAQSSRAHDTCQNTSSIKVVRGAVVGLSGVMAHSKDPRRGVLPSVDSCGGAQALRVALVAQHRNT